MKKCFWIGLMTVQLSFAYAEESKNPYFIEDVYPYHMLSFYGNQNAIENLFIKAKQPKIIIEVGSYLGASTAHLASIVGPNGKVYAVDWWKGLNFAQEKPVEGSHQQGWGQNLPFERDMYKQFLSNMIALGLTDIVVPIRSHSCSAVSILEDKGIQSADLVYIDADHSYTGVLADCEIWFPFVEGGKGILCGDDWSWSAPDLGSDYILGVQRAVSEFAKKKNLKVETNGTFWVLREI